MLELSPLRPSSLLAASTSRRTCPRQSLRTAPCGRQTAKLPRPVLATESARLTLRPAGLEAGRLVGRTARQARLVAAKALEELLPKPNREAVLTVTRRPTV